MTPETGTLRELKLNKGDVAECVDNDRAKLSLTVGRRYTATSPGLITDDQGSEYLWTYATFRLISRATPPVDLTGPVRTVTRKEIVPGVYGRLHIEESAFNARTVFIRRANRLGDIDSDEKPHCFTAAELRAAIATLTEIADALEGGDA